MAKDIKIPDWVKKSPITLKTYDLRVLWYGEIKQWGDHWPFLSRDPDVAGSAVESAWDAYFRDHLGGFPPTYRLYRDGVIQHLNAPETLPELFDPTYKPNRETADTILPFRNP